MKITYEVTEIVTSNLDFQVLSPSQFEFPQPLSFSLSLSFSFDLHTAPGSRHGSLYLHSSLSGRPHSAIILFRSFSWLSRHSLECRLPYARLRESEFSGSNYVTRRP